MAWVKLDEKFASHPKVVEAGPLGLAMQVAALCYCNQHLTDGRISRPAARMLLDFHGVAFVEGMYGDDATPDVVIDRLVEVGMWHEPGHDCPDCDQIVAGFVIHDYLEQQPSRAEVEAKKEQAAEAGRRGGLAKAKRTAKQDAKRTAKRIPSEPSSESPSGSLAEFCPDTDTDTVVVSRRKRLPNAWSPNDTAATKAKELGVDLVVEAEQFKNHHAAKGSQFVDWDRAFLTWLGNAGKWQKQRNPNAGRDFGTDEWLANA